MLVAQMATSMAQREEAEREQERERDRDRPRDRGPRATRVLESLAQAPGARARLAVDPTLALPGGAAHGLAALLILGGVFRARADASSLGDADPILVLEDPEAYLHPLVTANISRLIDALPVQRIVTTNSADLLTSVPLRALRRAVRRPDGVRVHAVPRRALSIEELRRVGYHVRSMRADALFARCWLLVEGETEFWVVPELARILGVDLPSEGVRVVEFAQCGLEPLVKLADALGIAWTLLADGDEAGLRYTERAVDLAGEAAAERVVSLEELDLEHCMWAHGFDGVYRHAAGLPPLSKKPRPVHVHPRDRRAAERGPSSTKVILRAKPRLALEVLEAAAERGPAGVPPPLRRLVETAVRLARAAAGVP
jgi:putative ATP-dependent endonuclease of the OLD family